jgi:hypothetical protein
MWSAQVGNRYTVALAVAAWLVSVAGVADAQKRYRVEIDTRPTGAEIFLDDADSEPIGTTPLKNKRLEPGTYTLVLKKDGFETQYEEINVRRGGDNRFVIELQRMERASLHVVADVKLGKRLDGARVLLDGEERGVLPLEVEVAVGSHVVEVTKNGFEPFEQWVEVNKGEREKVVAILEPRERGGIPRRVSASKSSEVDQQRPDEAGSSLSDSTPATPAVVVVGLGFQLGARVFRYDNPTTANLRSYDANFVRKGRAMIELYPLVPLDTPAIAGLGITGSVGRSVVLESSTSDGRSIESIWTDFDLGLRYQYDFGGVTAGGGIAYGRQDYAFDEDSELFGEVPVVDYRFVRFSGDVTGRVHRWVSLCGGASFLTVSSLGEIGDRFDNSSAFGVGVRVGMLGHITDRFDARLEANADWFKHSFEPDAAMMFVADGGNDVLGSVLLGIQFSY